MFYEQLIAKNLIISNEFSIYYFNTIENGLGQFLLFYKPLRDLLTETAPNHFISYI